MATLHDYIAESGCEISYEIEIVCDRCNGNHVLKVSKRGIYHFACDGEAFYGFVDMAVVDKAMETIH